MQKRDRKRYNREFKLEAVRRTQITGKSVAEENHLDFRKVFTHYNCQFTLTS
jgi:hypothetical protein